MTHRTMWTRHHVSPSQFDLDPGPCPFCLGRNLALYVGLNVQVECGGCGAEGPTIPTKARGTSYAAHEAVARWNTRP